MSKIIPILLTILLAGGAGFAVGRSMSSLDARVAASSALAASPCGQSAAAPVAGTPLSAEVRAEGPNCADAVLTLILRDAEGHPAWAMAAPYAAFTNLDVRETPPGPEEVAAAARTFATVEARPAASLPPWPEGQPSLTVEDGPYQATALDRMGYEALRASGGTLLCHPTGIESGVCLTPAPDGRSYTAVFESGV